MGCAESKSTRVRKTRSHDYEALSRALYGGSRASQWKRAVAMKNAEFTREEERAFTFYKEKVTKPMPVDTRKPLNDPWK